MTHRPPTSTLFPYTTLFRSRNACITAALARERIQGPLLDIGGGNGAVAQALERSHLEVILLEPGAGGARNARRRGLRSEEHTSELQSLRHLVCRLLLEKKNY